MIGSTSQNSGMDVHLARAAGVTFVRHLCPDEFTDATDE
jgi:hypothetical protein